MSLNNVYIHLEVETGHWSQGLIFGVPGKWAWRTQRAPTCLVRYMFSSRRTLFSINVCDILRLPCLKLQKPL